MSTTTDTPDTADAPKEALTRMSISGTDKAHEDFARLRELLAVPADELTMEQRMERVEAVALVLVESVATNLQVLTESVAAVDNQFVLMADAINRHAQAISMVISALEGAAIQPPTKPNSRIITLDSLGR